MVTQRRGDNVRGETHESEQRSTWVAMDSSLKQSSQAMPGSAWGRPASAAALSSRAYEAMLEADSGREPEEAAFALCSFSKVKMLKDSLLSMDTKTLTRDRRPTSGPASDDDDKDDFECRQVMTNDAGVVDVNTTVNKGGALCAQ